MYNVELIVTIGVFMALFLLNKKILQKNYKILNPVSVMVIVWLLVLVFHNFYFEISKNSYITLFCITIGVCFFCIGFWMAARYHFKDRKNSQNKTYNIKTLKNLAVIFTFLEIMRILYMLYVILRLAGSISFFLSHNTYVRMLYLERNNGLIGSFFEFFFNANGLIGTVIVPLYVASKPKKNYGLLILWIILECAFALLTMSKMCFILSIIVMSTTYLGNIGNIKIQIKITKKVLPLLVILMLFFLLVIGRQRNYSQGGEALLPIVIDKAIFYFTSSVEALNTYMFTYESGMELGRNTFSIPFRILQHFSSMNAGMNHAEAINVGNTTTNVYSWFRVFYIDFSYFGFILGPLLIGIIVGFLYSPSKKNLFAQVCNSWVVCMVAITFYNYLWGQTIYIFILIYAYFIDRFLGNKLYNNSIGENK